MRRSHHDRYQSLAAGTLHLNQYVGGAFQLRFRDYMVGPTLGIVPGIAAVTLPGSQLGALVTASDCQDLSSGGIGVVAILGLAAGVLLLLALRRYTQRRRTKC